jgi:sugar fermentation stimulation protein A
VGVHSALANKMVERALQLGAISELKMFPEVKREVKHVKNSRVDFVLSRKDENDVEHLKYVEVKSVTLATTTDCDNVCAVFPDTVSVRAQKHVKELTELIKKLPKTTSGAIIMLVQRNDCSQYAPSKVHDPEFARLCETASKEGVEIIAYSCSLEPPTSEKKGIVRLLPTPLEVVLQ